jgi:hypothetical protein
MSGMPEYNFPAFHAAEEALLAAGWWVYNPVHTPPPPGRNGVHSDDPDAWKWYMRHAIKMVTKAESIALLPGWENSRGARLELRIALSLGMTAFIYADEHLEECAPSQLWEVLESYE